MKMLGWLVAVGFIVNSAAADVTKGNFGGARPNAPASEKPPEVERKAEPKEKRRTYPFYGTLDSVNASEKTITLKGKKKNRVIIFTTETQIHKGASAGKISDGIPGERVSGSVRKNAVGKEEAVSIRFGPKPGGN